MAEMTPLPKLPTQRVGNQGLASPRTDLPKLPTQSGEGLASPWTSLPSQEAFEELYKNTKETVLVYFTASWCGPCRKLDWDTINKGLGQTPVYKCDVDENNYTPGYCGVRSIPSFLLVHPNKRLTGPVQMSDTTKIVEWIKTGLHTKQ